MFIEILVYYLRTRANLYNVLATFSALILVSNVALFFNVFMPTRSSYGSTGAKYIEFCAQETVVRVLLLSLRQCAAGSIILTGFGSFWRELDCKPE